MEGVHRKQRRPTRAPAGNRQKPNAKERYRLVPLLLSCLRERQHPRPFGPVFASAYRLQPLLGDLQQFQVIALLESLRFDLRLANRTLAEDISEPRFGLVGLGDPLHRLLDVLYGIRRQVAKRDSWHHAVVRLGPACLVFSDPSYVRRDAFIVPGQMFRLKPEHRLKERPEHRILAAVAVRNLIIERTTAWDKNADLHIKYLSKKGPAHYEPAVTHLLD